MQPYGAVLTEILNLDAAPFQELLDQYRKTVAEKDAEQAARAFQAVTNGFASLPLYRLYWNDVQLFASMDVRELFVGEAQEAFREYAMQDDTLPRFMQEQLDAIRLIQERYVWFLDGIFAGKPFEKKKGQKKIPLAPMICSRGYGAVRQRRQPWRRFEGGRAEGKRAILHPWHWVRGGGGRKNVL